jgi:hypothetical protein
MTLFIRRAPRINDMSCLVEGGYSNLIILNYT